MTKTLKSTRRIPAALVAAFLVLWTGTAAAGLRLDAIKARHVLTCGVGAASPGFSSFGKDGVVRGFDSDLCRAIAAAIFGDPAKVRFKPVATLPDFLKDDSIDVVFRGLTWTMQRETTGPLRFGPIVLYDGQSFLVRKDAGITGLAMLSGKTICTSTDAEFLSTLRYEFQRRHLTLKAMVKDKRADAAAAFFAGACAAFAADQSELAEALIARPEQAKDFTILPLTLTKEPLAPLLRKGDDEFFDVVRWTVFALIDAEELNIKAETLDTMRRSRDPSVMAFFAPAKDAPGFAPDWAEAAVKASGNYGEIFERNLGVQSPAHLMRGSNRLWSDGGVLYAPPIR